ncbi:hypothetical protein JCM9957A_70240 [Kineosporia succinea]
MTDRRPDEARRLPETTDWAVDRVAHHGGPGSPVPLRQPFTARFGTSPAGYRRSFRDRPGHITSKQRFDPTQERPATSG